MSVRTAEQAPNLCPGDIIDLRPDNPAGHDPGRPYRVVAIVFRRRWYGEIHQANLDQPGALDWAGVVTLDDVAAIRRHDPRRPVAPPAIVWDRGRAGWSRGPERA